MRKVVFSNKEWYEQPTFEKTLAIAESYVQNKNKHVATIRKGLCGWCGKQTTDERHKYFCCDEHFYLHYEMRQKIMEKYPINPEAETKEGILDFAGFTRAMHLFKFLGKDFKLEMLELDFPIEYFEETSPLLDSGIQHRASVFSCPNCGFGDKDNYGFWLQKPCVFQIIKQDEFYIVISKCPKCGNLSWVHSSNKNLN